MDEEAQRLLERLEAERKSLSAYGYEWPAIFDAVEFLLKRAKAVKESEERG
jgi:hypothetical protein